MRVLLILMMVIGAVLALVAGFIGFVNAYHEELALVWAGAWLFGVAWFFFKRLQPKRRRPATRTTPEVAS